jgi:hypothetical protein
VPSYQFLTVIKYIFFSNIRIRPLPLVQRAVNPYKLSEYDINREGHVVTNELY